MAARDVPTRWVWALAILIALIRPVMLVNHYLLETPPGYWLVDLEVYRNAGVSLLTGRPVYEAVTPPPQLLPFTYPPIAAVGALLLAIVPFALAGWVWTLAQFAVLGGAVWWLFGPVARTVTQRIGWPAWWPIALALIWNAICFLLPVSDGIKYGQVDIFLMVLCLVDLLRRGGRLPRGMLIGIATSIKLTPGIFIVHLLITRQWRAALTAIASAAATTGLAFVLVPQASFAFWGGALQDSDRLGLNDGTANQALRGMLMRAGWDSSAVWLVLALAVAVAGLAIARYASRQGAGWHEAAAVGLTGLLISPVSWIHHFVWIIVVIAAFATAKRWWLTAAVWLVFTLPLPWWGQWRMQQGLDFPASSSGNWGWQLVNDSYGLSALLLLPVLAWALAADHRVATQDSQPAAPSAVSP